MTLEDRINLFDEFMRGQISDELRNELINRGFFTAPASIKHNSSCEGGLFAHSYAVARCLVELSQKNNISWKKERSPYIVGMFHDYCKIDDYVAEAKGFKHNETPLLRGHGEKSVIMLSKFIDMTEEEIFCIRYHMGAFTEKDEWQNYTEAVKKYETVLWTHHADMFATFVKSVF